MAEESSTREGAHGSIVETTEQPGDRNEGTLESSTENVPQNGVDGHETGEKQNEKNTESSLADGDEDSLKVQCMHERK